MIVRVNQQGSVCGIWPISPPWCRRRPRRVMLPKCTGPADLVVLDHHLSALEVSAGLPLGGIGVVPIVTETAASIFALGSYAGAPRLLAMCFGAEDLAADLGVTPRLPDGTYPAAISAARAAVLAGAAAAGVQALDTPWPDPRDPVGLVREAEAARGRWLRRQATDPPRPDRPGCLPYSRHRPSGSGGRSACAMRSRITRTPASLPWTAR